MWKTDEEKKEYFRNWRKKRNEQRSKERINKSVEQDSIRCKICQQVIKSKGLPNHLKIHGINFNDYLVENLDDFKKYNWNLCSTCGKLIKGTTCSKKCMGKWRSTNFSGKNHPWWQRKHSPESLKKISDHRKGKGGFKGKLNPAKRPEVRDKISKTRKIRGVAKGKNNPMYGKTHTEESLRKIFEKRSFTKPEKLVIKLLKKSKIEFDPQWFLTENGKTYSYDFRIRDSNILIEVDGDYWHGGPGTNQHWFGVESTIKTDNIKDNVAQKHGFKVVRIWESELKSSPHILLEKLNVNI